MVTLSSKKYRFVGEFSDFFVFQTKREGDVAYLLVQQAKMVGPNGESHYYVPLKAGRSSLKDDHLIGSMADFERVKKVANNLSPEQRVCLTQSMRPTHIPKRSEADSDESVKELEVNLRKLVSANG